MPKRSDESDELGLGKNPRDGWRLDTRAHRGAHDAVFPPDLPRAMISAGVPVGHVPGRATWRCSACRAMALPPPCGQGDTINRALREAHTELEGAAHKNHFE